mmetsp:Transcript_10790/g.34009  ORF Transcript_10790/g.34009 Transcript_10790/m.34009 type:complete len:82 (-) Transcript_10790:106-351(-)
MAVSLAAALPSLPPGLDGGLGCLSQFKSGERSLTEREAWVPVQTSLFEGRHDDFAAEVDSIILEARRSNLPLRVDIGSRSC